MNDVTFKPKDKQIRMCIVCRKRFPQKSLNRLQCINGKLTFFTGRGRSFYVCNECVYEKKFIKNIAYICKFSKIRAKEEIDKIFGLNVISNKE